jgi:hypothetical protein
MRSKPLSLPFRVAVDPIIVQAGFPDRDNPRMTGKSDQSFDIRFLARLRIGVNTCGGKDCGKAFRNDQDFGKGFEVDRNAQRVRHLVGGHGLGYATKIGRKLGEIDVTVRIYKQFNILIMWLYIKVLYRFSAR